MSPLETPLASPQGGSGGVVLLGSRVWRRMSFGGELVLVSACLTVTPPITGGQEHTHLSMLLRLPLAQLVVAWLLVAPQPLDAPSPFNAPSGCCVATRCAAVSFAPAGCCIASLCTASATSNSLSPFVKNTPPAPRRLFFWMLDACR
jgi:hypothetical protein